MTAYMYKLASYVYSYDLNLNYNTAHRLFKLTIALVFSCLPPIKLMDCFKYTSNASQIVFAHNHWLVVNTCE